MSKPHTPGPWAIDWQRDSIDEGPVIYRDAVPGQLVAAVLGPLSDEDGPHRGEGDAYLICAAPSLLAACRAALPHLVNEPAYNAVSAALALAEGRPEPDPRD